MSCKSDSRTKPPRGQNPPRQKSPCQNPLPKPLRINTPAKPPTKTPYHNPPTKPPPPNKKQLLRLGTFDLANMSTCVGQLAKRKTIK